MNKNVFIFVGLAKTGSTFLRESILRQSSDLVFEDGHRDASPFSSLIKDVSSIQQLAFRDKNELSSIMDLANQGYKERISDYIQKLPPATSVVVSWPSFVGSFGGARDGFKSCDYTARLLKMVIPEAKVILVIREQKAYAQSLYSTYLKYGGVKQFRKFFPLDRVIDPNGDQLWLDPNDCDWVSILECFRDKFECLVIPYELLRKKPQEYYQRVSNFLDIELKMTHQRQLNRGLTSGSADKVRMLNMIRLSIGICLVKLTGRNSIREIENSRCAAMRAFGKVLRIFADFDFSGSVARVLTSLQSSISDRSSHVFLPLPERIRMSNQRLSSEIDYDLGSLGYEITNENFDI